jgi:ABC-type phosphate transport system substrate-binding protein
MGFNFRKMRTLGLLFALFCLSWDGFAQENNLDQLDFVANVKGVTALSSKEVVQIFRNGRSLWPTGEKVIIVLPSNKSDFAEIVARKLYGGNVTSMQKFWLALVFQGRANPPVFFQSSEEILAYVAKNPGAIGVLQKNSIQIPIPLLLTIL